MHVNFWFSLALLAFPPEMLLQRRGMFSGVNDWPCVLRSSLQCGDHWRENMEVFSGMVCMGVGESNEMDVVFQIHIVPPGPVVSVARSSGFHGHQAIA